MPTNERPAARYRKRPVEIGAIQWDGMNTEAVRDFGGEHMPVVWGTGGFCFIETLEGRMTVSPGDWIVRGVKGEFYPVKPDIFEATYEPV